MKRKVTTGPGIMIVIPTLGRPVPLKWAVHFKSINPPINFNTEHFIIENKPIAEARNAACKAALEKGCKYLFFWGDDVVPHSLNTLKQLIFRMETVKDCGVVGGIYCSKTDPAAPLIFKGNGRGSYWNWKIGEFLDVTGIGMDCTLIRLDILKDIKEPWFKTVEEDTFDEGINKADQWTEDLYFCKKVVEETDWKVYADCSLLCGHLDVYEGREYNLPTDCPPVTGQPIDGTKTKKIVDLGCGEIDRSTDFKDYNLVRVDIREECNPDYRCDLHSLPFANEEFDIVFSSHVLEHFSRGEWETVLREWIRVLKIDGRLHLILPNLEWALDNFDTNKIILTQPDAYNVIYGGQTNDFDYHKVGFTPSIINAHLKALGFKEITIEKEGYNMLINATKTGS